MLQENFELRMKFVCFQESYERAKNILKTHQREHKMLAEALLKYETLDAEDIKAIMAGKETPDRSH
jgi:ATP-dependent Zn proteases